MKAVAIDTVACVAADGVGAYRCCRFAAFTIVFTAFIDVLTFPAQAGFKASVAFANAAVTAGVFAALDEKAFRGWYTHTLRVIQKARFTRTLGLSALYVGALGVFSTSAIVL